MSTIQENTYEIEYQAPVPNKIIVSKTYFPGWTATSQSGPLNVEPYSEYGVIAIPITEPEGKLKLELKSTPIQTISNYISAFALVIILVLLVNPRIPRGKKS